MLKIRLQRVGRKHDPAFRVIVTRSTQGPKSGKYIEKLGFYHAKTGEKSFNKDRIKHWIDNGAQVSGTVHNFLVDEGIVDGKKKNVLPKRKPKKEEKPETEKPKKETESTEEETPAEEVKPAQGGPNSGGEEKKEEQKEAEDKPKSEASPKESKEEAPTKE